MKILVAHTYYQQAGGEDTVFAQEVDMLRREGHEVVTYTRSNNEIQQYGVVDKLMLFPNTIWSSASRADFGAVLDRERPELVHFHNTFMVMSPSVYAACKERSVAVVQTLHNFRLSCPGGAFFRKGAPCEECATKGVWNGVRHKCYRNSRVATAAVASMLAVNRAHGTWSNMVDCYIALTEFARDRIRSSGIPDDKIHVKPNFVAPDPGVRSRADNYALYTGRLVVEKGVPTLVAAWKGLDGKLPLRIIGDGPQRKNLEMARRLNNVKEVEFLGLKPREEVIEQIRAARFVVFPSESYENFPMAIVEAYACGVPVIAAKIGSTAEIVHDGITGLTFTPGNAEELRHRVEWAMEHPHLMEEMGRRARMEFEVKYSAKRNYGMLMNIYEFALGRKTFPRRVAASEAA
jgi:glycosyltransferase involved in cell wall biosynthesis